MNISFEISKQNSIYFKNMSRLLLEIGQKETLNTAKEGYTSGYFVYFSFTISSEITS
jgi:hypothetical protein